MIVVNLCMYNQNTEWAEWLWVEEAFMLCVLSAKKLRVLGNEKCELCFNWDYWDYFGSVLCPHVCCMIFHCWHELECGFGMMLDGLCA